MTWPSAGRASLGVLWYRLLIGHAPLDERAARDLAVHLVAAGCGAAE
jgi:hypothetical protein